jgi:hypothetical protein
MKNSDLPLYQPPRARDLSAFSASGMVPLGVCESGAKPFEECIIGPSPEGWNPPCETGGFALDPRCYPGSWAASVCKVGGEAG